MKQEEIGPRLRKMRHDSEMCLKDVALLSGYSETHVCNMENCRKLSIKSLCNILQLYGYEIEFRKIGLKCDRDCFNCKYDDCIEDCGSREEIEEINRRNVADRKEKKDQSRKEYYREYYRRNRDRINSHNKENYKKRTKFKTKCQWYKYGADEYRTDCGEVCTRRNYRAWSYCPKCGRKIVREEGTKNGVE